jgi:hypothetical protein
MYPPHNYYMLIKFKKEKQKNKKATLRRQAGTSGARNESCLSFLLCPACCAFQKSS